MAKLIDILARELDVWPEGAAVAVQDSDSRQTVKFAGPRYQGLDLGLAGGPKDLWLSHNWDFTHRHDFRCKDLAEDSLEAIITRAQWQDARDALLAGESVKAWDGEGLPPVGVRIEIAHKDAQPDWARPGFYETKIIAMGEQLMILEADVSGHEKVAKISAYHFRPIRTAEQIAVDEREKSCKQICIDAGSPECTASQMQTAYRLFDAGYRKQEQ